MREDIEGLALLLGDSSALHAAAFEVGLRDNHKVAKCDDEAIAQDKGVAFRGVAFLIFAKQKPLFCDLLDDGLVASRVENIKTARGYHDGVRQAIGVRDDIYPECSPADDGSPCFGELAGKLRGDIFGIEIGASSAYDGNSERTI